MIEVYQLPEKGIIHLLQVSLPVQALALLSSLVTLTVILVAVYLLRKGSGQRENIISTQRIPSDSQELFLLIKDWRIEKHKMLLSNFLLDDEFAVLEILIQCLGEDNLTITEIGSDLRIVGDGGWRNKHQILSLSKLSNRRIYEKNGIVERLVELGLAEIRDAPSGWGRQTHQYRASTVHPLVKSIFSALLRELAGVP